MADKRNQNAEFQIKDGQLVVSIGLEALKRSVGMDADLTITDEELAADAILGEVASEEENGRTRFHVMLAQAAVEAFSNGAEGFEEIED